MEAGTLHATPMTTTFLFAARSLTILERFQKHFLTEITHDIQAIVCHAAHFLRVVIIYHGVLHIGHFIEVLHLAYVDARNSMIQQRMDNFE